MITIEQARKIDPSLDDLTDEQLRGVLAELYELGQLAFETWLKEKRGSKFPTGVLPKTT